MFAWIPKLFSGLRVAIPTILPFLQPLFDKWSGGDSAEIQKIKAQAELIEAKAFAKGKYSPKYLLKYIVIGLFTFWAALTILGAFWPQLFNISSGDVFNSLIKHGSDLLNMGD
jgi:hypothetical protein